MIRYHEFGKPIAEITEDNIVITEVQDMLDLMGECGARDCYRIVVREAGLHPDFFRLHTGMAGEILQKFSTYDFKLAVVGDFSKYTSRNLQDFIHESNKGNRIFFVNDMDEALKKLQGY
jgi:hypothetical protein